MHLMLLSCAYGTMVATGSVAAAVFSYFWHLILSKLFPSLPTAATLHLASKTSKSFSSVAKGEENTLNVRKLFVISFDKSPQFPCVFTSKVFFGHTYEFLNHETYI